MAAALALNLLNFYQGSMTLFPAGQENSEGGGAPEGRLLIFSMALPPVSCWISGKLKRAAERFIKSEVLNAIQGADLLIFSFPPRRIVLTLTIGMFRTRG